MSVTKIVFFATAFFKTGSELYDRLLAGVGCDCPFVWKSFAYRRDVITSVDGVGTPVPRRRCRLLVVMETTFWPTRRWRRR